MTRVVRIGLVHWVEETMLVRQVHPDFGPQGGSNRFGSLVVVESKIGGRKRSILET